MLSLVCLLHSRGLHAQAVVEEDARLLVIPSEDFDRLMGESDDFRRYLVNSMTYCISGMMQLVSRISFSTLDLRLAHIIHQFSDRTSQRTVKFTHQALANELGTSREVVSRLLKGLERAGTIRLKRGSIEIIDKRELKAIRVATENQHQFYN